MRQLKDALALLAMVVPGWKCNDWYYDYKFKRIFAKVIDEVLKDDITPQSHRSECRCSDCRASHIRERQILREWDSPVPEVGLGESVEPFESYLHSDEAIGEEHQQL